MVFGGLPAMRTCYAPIQQFHNAQIGPLRSLRDRRLILNAGRNSVVVTGNGGDDRYLFQHRSWNGRHITDFVSGSDVLDLRPLFSASGYSERTRSVTSICASRRTARAARR
jgi:hypothetical protein